MEREEKVVLEMNAMEQGVVVRALNDLRNDLIHEKRPTDFVEEILLKTIDAPKKQKKGRRHEER